MFWLREQPGHPVHQNKDDQNDISLDIPKMFIELNKVRLFWSQVECSRKVFSFEQRVHD